MRLKIIFLSLCCCLVSLFAPAVFAANIQITGKVSSLDTPTIGGTIVLKDSATHAVVSTQIIDPSGNYALFVPQGTYDIAFVPPTAGVSQSIVKANQHIDSSREYNFVVPTFNDKKSLNLPKNNVVKYILLVIALILLLLGGAWIFIMKKL